MDLLNTLQWWVILLLGLSLGLIFGSFIMDKIKHDGLIHITLGEGDDKDLYLFEFITPPEEIPKMKTVTFKVVIDSQNIHSL